MLGQLLPYKFHSSSMRGILCFNFASCEPLRQPKNMLVQYCRNTNWGKTNPLKARHSSSALKKNMFYLYLFSFNSCQSIMHCVLKDVVCDCESLKDPFEINHCILFVHIISCYRGRMFDMSRFCEEHYTNTWLDIHNMLKTQVSYFCRSMIYLPFS